MPLLAQDWEEENRPEAEKIEKKAKEKYFSKPDADEFEYTQNTTINAADTIKGNIIVRKADLTVHGTINGDVLVIYGDIFIKEDARINGDVTSVDGKIFQDMGSMVTGNQVETRAKNLVPHSRWDEADMFDDEDWDWEVGHRFRGSYSTLPLQEIDEHVLLRYNRVQGLFLGVNVPKSIRGKYNIVSLHGFLGYGFQEKRWRFEAGLDRWIFNQRDYRFEIGAKIYDLTDSRDNWLLSDDENSLSAFFLNKDYHDFYRRTGFEFHASQNLSIFLKGTVVYRNDDYESLEKNTDWALFGGKKDFKENPPILEGNMRSVYGELYLDTRDNKELPRRGWYGKLSMEVSNQDLSSDFSFNQYIFEVRRYQNFGRGERIDLRFKAGSSEGYLPIQKWYEIGGVSTLRGFGFKEFFGDRMLLGNIEYNISPRTFSSTFLFLDELNYVIFYDFGTAWFADQVTAEDKWYEGFSHLALNDISSDLGIALTFNDGKYRINFAKRLDTNKKPLVVSFRIVKPF